MIFTPFVGTHLILVHSAELTRTNHKAAGARNREGIQPTRNAIDPPTNPAVNNPKDIVTAGN